MSDKESIKKALRNIYDIISEVLLNSSEITIHITPTFCSLHEQSNVGISTREEVSLGHLLEGTK